METMFYVYSNDTMTQINYYCSGSQFIVLVQVIHDLLQHINSINFMEFSIYDDGLHL